MYKALFLGLVAQSLMAPSVGHAGSVTAAIGVTFEAPDGLIALPGQQHPIKNSWKDFDDTMSVTVMAVATSRNDSLAGAREFQDWPGVGRSFVNGFGNGYAKSLEKALRVNCNFVGLPRSRDLEKMAIQVEIETTCNTKPNPYFIRTRVIQMITQSNTITFRVDSRSSADARAQAVVANLWQSIRIASEQKITLPTSSSENNSTSALGATAVVGGAGMKIRDYGLKNSASIVGEYIGGIISSILFGMLFALLLMKMRIPPLPSLVCAQFLIAALRVYGAEKDGTWEIDPILYLVTATISIATLRKWAQARWAKQIKAA